MSVEQLAELDQDPLVASVPACTSLVAHAYLSRYLGAAAGPGRGESRGECWDSEPEVLGCEASLRAWEGPCSPQREPEAKRRRVVEPGAARRAIVFPLCC